MARRRGRVIIPSFAVGRTQEIVYALNQLDARGDIPEIPVFVDSPLAVNATTVLFVSFQAQHTLGRRILEGKEEVRIFSEAYRVRAEVARINGYSAHADHADLLQWASHFDQDRLQKIFLVHGEPEGAGALAEGLREQGQSDVVVPTLHQSFEL